MEDGSEDIPDHPDGLPFPEGGIQAIEGPNGHQRILGEAARFIYAGFDEIVKVVVRVTNHDTEDTNRYYRAILRDERGGVHLGGGDGDTDWIDLDYGWTGALEKVEDLIEPTSNKEDNTSMDVLEGEEEYRQLRAQMN